jgi:hypothetical protein
MKHSWWRCVNAECNQSPFQLLPERDERACPICHAPMVPWRDRELATADDMMRANRAVRFQVT